MRRSGDRSTSTIERLGPDDLVALATDVGPVPYQVGAVVVLDAPVPLAKVGERLAERVGGVARLRQKLTDAPFGGGCPYWLDDPSFRIENHIEQLRLDNATIESLYDASVAVVTRPLGKDRPLWRVTVVDGLDGGGGALAAVSAALGRLLATRGESVDELIVSMPVSRRRETSVSDLGNDVASVPVVVPMRGTPRERLDTVAERTRVAKANPKEPPTVMVGTLFRVLAKAGAFGWFVNRQHMVHTFLTNMKGPEVALYFLGTEISEVVPIAMVAGNVAVSFAAMSYAGTISVAVLADPDVCPELDELCRLVDEELAAVTQYTT